ncbi:MAG: type II toxin-antitoxin system RatA family toxin [Candidatus Berkiella sp.]
MKRIQRVEHVPYSPQQMFDLVNDVAQYPSFLPWCASTHIAQQSPLHMEATLHISKGPLRKAFTTLNRLIPNERIEMRLKQGPFKHLEGIWHFEPQLAGTKVSFEVCFEFQNPFLGVTLGPVFAQIAQSMVQAFSQRAAKVYCNAIA